MQIIEKPYEELANAIVILAAKDYKQALRALMRDPESSPAQQRVNSIEHFFCSQWYRQLTKVDGHLLLKKLKEAVA